jgi:aspartate/methionine/tyrosine aminotransferase
MLAEFDKRRQLIVSELNTLPGVTCTDAAGAFYAFPNISGTGKSSTEIQNLFLEKAGVATVSGTAFGAWGEGYVRFSYANSLENIQTAINRIRDVM